MFSNNTHAGEWMPSDRETSNNAAAIVHEKAKNLIFSEFGKEYQVSRKA